MKQTSKRRARMFPTKVTEMLGIEHPIICGGMMWVSEATLIAAVSEAGGLGILASNMFPDRKSLQREIRKIKSLTKKPFGVNINLFPALRPPNNQELIEVCIEEGVRAIETSGRSPEEYVKQIKDGGITLIHKVARIKDAKKAEGLGADIVGIIGYECGGAPPMDETTTLIQVPLAADALNVPVLAGGGIGDGRGLVAALALGASGVIMGTAFMATEECQIHPNIKEAIVRAQATDTIPLLRSIRSMERVLKTSLAMRVYEMEQKGASFEELIPLIAGEKSLTAWQGGEVEEGLIPLGQVVGLISRVKTVKELIDGIVQEAEAVVRRLGSLNQRTGA
jgi:nitronate monooxygenase